MSINVQLTRIADAADVSAKLDALSSALTAMEDRIMQEFQELITEVEETKTVQQSAIVLLNGLKTRLDEIIAAGVKKEDVVALRNDLDTSNTALADAVTANTPAEDENPPA